MTMTASLKRIRSLLLRHFYLYRQSWPRMIGVVIWPAVNMLNIGFLNTYLASPGANTGVAFGMVLGGIILWDWFVRTQVGTMLALMEEVWSRNLGQLFVTPLRDGEYFISLFCVGLMTGVGSMVIVMIVAHFCFGFSTISLGLPLGLLLMNLILFGWSFGLIANLLILRFGQSAEWILWALPYLIMPLAAVYYPVAILPHWLQPISAMIPITYVFEGLRTILNTGLFPMMLFWKAIGLNALAMAISIFAAMSGLRLARQRGALLQIGE